MKIAVSSTGRDLDSQVDPRFGRCACILIVDTDDLSFEAYDNENAAMSGGAGIQTASQVAARGIGAVLTGNCGPKAMQIFDAEGIKVFAGQDGTIREAVDRFKSGSLSPLKEATVSEKGGLSMNEATETTSRPSAASGGNVGVGRGMGGGRGMGCGGGKGMGGGRGKGCGRGMGGGKGMGRR